MSRKKILEKSYILRKKDITLLFFNNIDIERKYKIMEITYEVRKEAFNHLCSTYTQHNRWAKTIQANTFLSKIGDTHLQYDPSYERNRQYLCLLQQLHKFHTMLDAIEIMYGEQAKVLVYRQYALKEKQSVLALEYGISVRTLQRRMHTWIYGVLMEECVYDSNF